MASPLSQPQSNINSGVKLLAETSQLKSVPSEFSFESEPAGLHSDLIPVIDFSLLASGNPEQRSKAIQQLGKACKEWGFFVLVNHGIPESLMKGIINATLEFFDLPEAVKRNMPDPIKYGTGSATTTSDQKILLWRDSLKFHVHPQFHCPDKPQILRDILFEYAEKCRSVVKTLVKGISEDLGLKEGYIEDALKLESMFQLFNANYYPPCPQPDQAIGIPLHTDHGLFTLLIHNGVPGLQIEHNGNWFNENSPQNALLVNTGDQLEMFSNGKYKSAKHRALVNQETKRISIVIANGPAPDAIVSPASELVDRDGRQLYRPMEYMEYIITQQTNRLNGKTNLEMLKVLET